MARQGTLRFPTWGGSRRGAGRKPLGPTAGVPHRRRPGHDGAHPAHVTLRVVSGCPSLRSKRVFSELRTAFAKVSTKRFHVAHFSVQTNHVHLVVEAANELAIGRGMQGLGIRLAKAINRVSGRRGRVWADRYHARALRTPKELRNALVYVLLNGRKHHVTGPGTDPCSSGLWFDGWKDLRGAMPGASPIMRARTWLLRVGWRRHGLIDFTESPVATRGRLRR